MSKQEAYKRVGSYIIFQNVLLGKGSFGVVKKAYNEQTKQYVAAKIISKTQILQNADPQKLFNSIQREIDTMKKTKGKNYILELLDISATNSNIYIFVELCESGSLYDYWLKNKPLSEHECQVIFLEIITAFKAIDEANILHRDIKPQNILIKNQVMKIADFGFAKPVVDNEIPQEQTLLGTPKYVAPEILFNEQYSNKVDVFSVGIMIFELLFNVHPYFNQALGLNDNFALSGIMNIKKLYRQFQSQNIKVFSLPEFANKINSEFEQLLANMIEIDQEKRMKWSKLFQHPYLVNLEKMQEKLKNQIANESDDFQRSIFMQEQFLNQKRVYGQIQENIQTGSEINYAPTNKIIQQNASNVIEYNSDSADKHSLRFHQYTMYLLNERNQAVLYFEFFRKIYNNQTLVMNLLGKSLTYQLEFCFTKLGVQLLKTNPIYKNERLIKFIKYILKLDQPSIPQDEQDILNEYLKSAQYQLTKQKIENDTLIQETTLNGLKSQFLQKFQENPQDPVNATLISQIKNNELVQQHLIAKLKNDAEGKFHSQLTKPLLQIWLLMKVSTSPYNYFPIEKDNDYYSFYEKLEKDSEAVLNERIEEIKLIEQKSK